MASDSKAVRRYQAGVERALALFDAKNEWADYIAFLGRLLKALQAAPADADIPSKETLATYLAECLSPTLPAGVHQKALEVYECIFSILGQDGLSKDLPLYHPGFAETLTFASLTTRPWFLALYNDHILGLPPDSLRLPLNALISSLLPGIEEENSEDFDKILGTLNKLRRIFAESAEEGTFWQNFFLASIEDSGLRAGALVYMLRYLPKIVQQHVADGTVGTSVQDIVTPEPGLLFRCFATGLEDEQPLVQRGFLDLLVTNLPLDSPTLQKAESRKDLIILISAAMSIVLKRDMSLNRRLWTWFLGNDEKSDTDTLPSKSPLDGPRRQSLSASSYYSDFGLQAVIDAVDQMLQKLPTAPAQRARPYRLVVSLMDRSAVGGPVVDSLFRKLIANLKQYQTSAPSQEAFDEAFRSANVLFDSIEPRRLARYFFQLIFEEEWDLLEFIVLNFVLDDAELGRIHLPAVAACLCSIGAGDPLGRGEHAANNVAPRARQAAMVLDTILTFIPILTPKKSRNPRSRIPPNGILQTLKDSYLDNKKDVMPPEDLLMFAANELIAAIVPLLQPPLDMTVLDYLVSAFGRLINILPADTSIHVADLISSIGIWSASVLEVHAETFALSGAIATLVTILSGDQRGGSHIDKKVTTKVVPSLIRHWWRYLGPSTPQFHVESVELIWSLQSISPEMLLVDSTIMGLIGEESSDAGDHPSIRFGTLWTHTKTATSTPTLNGTSQQTRVGVPSLLEQGAILTVDRSHYDAVWTSWLGTLSSLDLHVRIVADSIETKGSDSEEQAFVGLCRLRKLIQIARNSATLWKDFHERQRLSSGIVNLVSKKVMLHQSDERSAQVALEIMGTIHSKSGVAMGSDLALSATQESTRALLSSDLIEALISQLPLTRPESSFQTNLLDTLHTLMSRRPDGVAPTNLLSILMEGIANPEIDTNLDKWITLLCNSIPTYPDATFFANLLKLTACFCKRIQAFFGVLKSLFDQEPTMIPARDPEKSVANLLSGLEYILARAHTKVVDTGRPTSSAGQDAPTSGAGKSRTIANHRLTVVLCMQDAIKVCCQMWFWQPLSVAGSASSAKSFAYMSSRLRSKARRILEHLLEAEPQECLETVMGIWVDRAKSNAQPGLVMNLLQTLDGARPKFMLPAIFNALYSRTNPNVLDSGQRSTLSVEASAVELVAFLIEYVTKLEDDLLEEIWNDCVSFTRDVLGNPMPQRQLLLRLLEFLAALCAKMENTTFGEQSRMRRELADIITRLSTAIFTIKPVGMDEGSGNLARSTGRLDSGKGIDILLGTLPAMTPILSEGDRISTVFQGISTNIAGPALRSRSFPQTLDNNVLGLYQITAKGSANSKIWRKDLTDAFNDARLFNSSLDVAKSGWIPVLRQLSAVDRNMFPDVMARLVAPATAGIMFGVGASAARAEADKAAKMNLKRLCLLLMAQEKDFFAAHIGSLMARIKELLTATPSSSPSSNTRGDIYLLFRAMLLCLAEENLVALWPDLTAEFRKMFKDMSDEEGNLTSYSQLQAAKLLDLLLLLKPRGFQRRKWVFVTDTIDAIYPPATLVRIAAADSIHMESGNETIEVHSKSDLRKPWLAGCRSPNLLGSFYSQLSIRAFEATYSLEVADVAACRDDLLADLFSDADSST